MIESAACGNVVSGRVWQRRSGHLIDGLPMVQRAGTEPSSAISKCKLFFARFADYGCRSLRTGLFFVSGSARIRDRPATSPDLAVGLNLPPTG